MHLSAFVAAVALSLGLAQAPADQRPGDARTGALSLEIPLGQVRSIAELKDGEYAVVLCRDGASRLQEVTSHNTGRALRIVIDGVPLDTATIVGPIIGGRLSLRATSEERRALVERLVRPAPRAQGAAAKRPGCDEPGRGESVPDVRAAAWLEPARRRLL